MKYGEVDFDQEDRSRAELRDKQQRKEERRRLKRKIHTIFLVFGLCLKLCAVVFSLVTLIIHGGKFEVGGIISTDGVHHLSGPGVDYLIGLYIMTVFALFSLVINAVGPCSIYERGHFGGSLLFLVNDISYASVGKAVLDKWPANAGGWSPTPWLVPTMGAMVVSGMTMAVSAWRLSGAGCHPAKKAKEIKCVSMRAYGELQEGELQELEGKSEVATAAYSKYKEHKKQKQQRENRQQRERLLSDTQDTARANKKLLQIDPEALD